MVFVRKDNRSWSNIIKLAWNTHPWESKTAFKTALFSIILEKQESEVTGILRRKESRQEQKIGKNKFKIDKKGREKIKEMINKYRPDLWFPEIIEAFFSQFEASSSGQFYTPEACCRLLADIALLYIDKEVPTVYDPACGCGSLLYGLGLKRPKSKLQGQELNRKNIRYARFFLEKWDTKLKETNTLYKNRTMKKFDIVLCNPPFNQKLNKEVYQTKEGNTAWTRLCLNHTKHEGITIIILSSTILNGEKFKECRKELIQKNLLEAAVLLPNKIFANTFVEVCFLVVKRKREKGTPIFLLDSSSEEEPQGNINSRKNILREKIFQDYKDLNGMLVTKEEIKANNYSLTFANYKKKREGGIPIGKLFNHFWSHDGGEILEHKSLEVKGTMFSNYSKKMQIAEKGTTANKQVVYFWKEGGGEEDLKQLANYLKDNHAELKTFYTGAIIKHLRKDEFLKHFRVDLKENSHDAHTHMIGETNPSTIAKTS